MQGLPPVIGKLPKDRTLPESGILSLHLEDVFIDTDATIRLAKWFSETSLLETLQLSNV